MNYIPVPIDEEFNDSGYEISPDLAELATTLIKENNRFRWLIEDDVKVAYLWKQKGGNVRARAKLGMVQRTPKLLRLFVKEEYVIWLAADYHRGDDGQEQIERTLFHELCHFYKDKKGRITLQGHDHEYFDAEEEKYGKIGIAHVQ